MILIIDSGATKTDYALISANKTLFRFANEGINISYTNDAKVDTIVNQFYQALPKKYEKQIQQILFYGAGCGKVANAERIDRILQSFFPDTKVSVHSDLLGACRALCGDEAGWVGILGTGSSSCYYDGRKIVYVAPSLGYLLGDEGSGTHLGKLFLTAYLSKQLSSEVQNRFEQTFQIDTVAIIDKLYRQPFPNKFLSSISPFLLKNVNMPEIATICHNSFNEYLEKTLHFLMPHISQKELNLMGSVAFHYREIISEIAKKHGIVVRKVIKAPLECGKWRVENAE